jgi:AcrR family transcriptional regulator
VTDGRRARGDRTRARILDAGVGLAAERGLVTFSLSDLAAESDTSKAGINTLFGSKATLQAGIIDRARQIVEERVFRSVVEVPPGRARLVKLGQVWLDYLGDPSLRGGCFFASATSELDSQLGDLRDAIAETMTGWIHRIETIVEDGQRNGELDATTDADDEALLFFSIAVTANSMIQLGLDAAEQRARRNWKRQVDRLSITPA